MKAKYDDLELYLSLSVANAKLVNPDCVVPVQLDLKKTEQCANNVCTAQLAPARFVLLGATGS